MTLLHRFSLSSGQTVLTHLKTSPSKLPRTFLSMRGPCGPQRRGIYINIFIEKKRQVRGANISQTLLFSSGENCESESLLHTHTQKSCETVLSQKLYFTTHLGGSMAALTGSPGPPVCSRTGQGQKRSKTRNRRNRKRRRRVPIIQK